MTGRAELSHPLPAGRGRLRRGRGRPQGAYPERALLFAPPGWPLCRPLFLRNQGGVKGQTSGWHARIPEKSLRSPMSTVFDLQVVGRAYRFAREKYDAEKCPRTCPYGPKQLAPTSLWCVWLTDVILAPDPQSNDARMVPATRVSCLRHQARGNVLSSFSQCCGLGPNRSDVGYGAGAKVCCAGARW